MKIITLPPENKYPDCLFMKLHGESVNTSLSKFPLLESLLEVLPIPGKRESIAKQVELQLTIRFGECQFELDLPKPIDGKVSFGLRGGRLKLQLTNAIMLLETIKLTPSLFTTMKIEKKQEKGRESGVSGSLSTKLGVDGKIQEINKTTTTFHDEVAQVYNEGTEEEPIWVFQVKNNKSILTGILQKVMIGQLQIQEQEKPSSIKATFKVEDEHIYITKGNVFFSKNIIREKTAWIEREIALRFIRATLNPYISLAELSYE